MIKPQFRFCSSALTPEYSLKDDPAGAGPVLPTTHQFGFDQIYVNVFNLLVILFDGARYLLRPFIVCDSGFGKTEEFNDS